MTAISEKYSYGVDMEREREREEQLGEKNCKENHKSRMCFIERLDNLETTLHSYRGG